MKHPFSVVLIEKDPETQREIQLRFDTHTSMPKMKLFAIWFKFLFRGMK
jgi:hypothetical protein